jgi:type I restriction enzyme S subunit
MNLSPEGAAQGFSTAELPQGWRETTFGELVRSISINDKKLPAKQYAESGKFPVVDQGQQFIGGYSDDEDRLVSDELPLIVFGDHTRIFKYLDRAFVPGADGIKVLKPIGVDEKWLFHIAHALDFPDKGYARHFQHLKQATIFVPPLPEQRRIVARIEELFSRLDAGVAALRHAKAQLQRYRQSVLAAAVTGQLTQAWREQHPDTEPAEELLKRILEHRREQWNGRGKYKEPVDFNHTAIFKLPESWKWTSLDQLMLNITDGDHQAPPQTDVGIPFLVIGNIRSGSISFDGSRFVRVDYYKSLDCFRTPSHGDILYSLVGSFGIAVRVKSAEPFCVQRHIGILRPHSASPTSFLTQVLNSRFVFDQASEVSTGTAQKTVPLSGLRKIATPLPPLAEQYQIVAEVEARTTAIDHLEAELDRQITRSNRLRQSTLASAFRGKLS